MDTCCFKCNEINILFPSGLCAHCDIENQREPDTKCPILYATHVIIINF